VTDQYPMAKVTIIIEQGDGIFTTVIPKAMDPWVHVNNFDGPTMLDHVNGFHAVSPIRMAFSVEGVGYFDPEIGSTIQQTRTKKDAPLAIFDILSAHSQSARNRHCSCGWRPTWPDDRIDAASIQHQHHLAEELEKVMR
jgi:hypothetical protein